MSRSNNVDLKNPATKSYQWSGKKGEITSYDKESKTKSVVPLPFRFVVLDALSCITGWNGRDKVGYYSNEVKDIKNAIITVRTKNGEYASGVYADVIKQCPGAKYAQAVYVMVKEGEQYIIAKFIISGSSLGSWIEFRKNNDVFKGGVVIKDSTDGKNGDTVYRIPTYETMALTQTAEDTALELDKSLQEYIKAYLGRVQESEVSEPVPATAEVMDDSDDLPF